MTRMVDCVFLQKKALGLDAPPFPGELAERIYLEVSKEAWEHWIRFLVMLINENGLDTARAEHRNQIYEYMRGYFFQEGEYKDILKNFRPSLLNQ